MLFIFRIIKKIVVLSIRVWKINKHITLILLSTWWRHWDFLVLNLKNNYKKPFLKLSYIHRFPFISMKIKFCYLLKKHLFFCLCLQLIKKQRLSFISQQSKSSRHKKWTKFSICLKNRKMEFHHCWENIKTKISRISTMYSLKSRKL